MDVIVRGSIRRVALLLSVTGILLLVTMASVFAQRAKVRPDRDEHDILYRATGVIETIAGTDNEERFIVRITEDSVGHFEMSPVCFLYPRHRWPPLMSFTSGDEVYIDYFFPGGYWSELEASGMYPVN